MTAGIVGAYFALRVAVSANNQPGIPNNANNPRGFRGTRDLSQICSQQPPENGTDTPPAGSSDIRTKIAELCADGVITDAEKQELQQLFQNMPRGRRFGTQNSAQTN